MPKKAPIFDHNYHWKYILKAMKEGKIMVSTLSGRYYKLEREGVSKKSLQQRLTRGNRYNLLYANYVCPDGKPYWLYFYHDEDLMRYLEDIADGGFEVKGSHDKLSGN